MRHPAGVEHNYETRGLGGAQMAKAGGSTTPGEGRRTLWVLDELVTYKIPSRQTGGAYALFEVVTQPGVGPPPHVQHREDESFYVLEGDYEFLIGRETLRVGAGSLIYVFKGTLHSHKNVGKGVGRMLVTQTPGGLYERFFEEVGKEVDGGGERAIEEQQPEAKGIVKIAAEHGIEIPAPHR
jgi:mannose-6-phosphate isomerase-like protein (cupin superfamily)